MNTTSLFKLHCWDAERSTSVHRDVKKAPMRRVLAGKSLNDHRQTNQEFVPDFSERKGEHVKSSLWVEWLGRSIFGSAASRVGNVAVLMRIYMAGDVWTAMVREMDVSYWLTV